MHSSPLVRSRSAASLALVACSLGVLLTASLLPAAKPAGVDLPRTAVAWTADEARQELSLHPHDAYLQYVVLQLGRRSHEDYADFVRSAAGVGQRAGRRQDVDLFNLFTGALAVQESLQLDTMTGNGNGLPVDDEPPPQRGKLRQAVKALASLRGPEVKSHPWDEMLAGRKPQVSTLSRCVPADFYLVEARSLSKLLEVIGSADEWGAQVAGKGLGRAVDQRASGRLRRQLAVRDEPALRPLYDLAVDGAAITGSDPFLREGADVTLLFHLKQPELFRTRLAALLDDAQRQTPGAERSDGEIGGVKYVALTSPDRRVNVFAADPSPALHVRSNSKAALERVLKAMADDGRASLGRTSEFAYVRTLMPAGAAEEDVLIYLSDPLIRHLVGPQLKITERRRVVCYNHLRMLAHASTMFQTEFGRPPASIDELRGAQCLPDNFGQRGMACPDGGTYSLSADGQCGVCSVHGRADAMTPCIEIPLARVTRAETEAYKGFVEQYNQYWRTYFDPIAIRLQATPRQLRAETIILPLIDNSIYTSLAHALGGKPEALDALPVPKREIFSVSLRLNKEELLKEISDDVERGVRTTAEEWFGPRGRDLDVKTLVSRGLGNQAAFHIYDAPQTFGFNAPEFIAEMLPMANRGRGIDEEFLWFTPLIVSFNSPVYVSIPVQEAKVVDDFLAKLDRALAADARHAPSAGGWFRIDRDFYRGDAGDGGDGGDAKSTAQRRAAVMRFGPVSLRFFWERIGGGLYIASKPFILDDLRAAAVKQNEKPAADATGHAMLRVRADHFDAVLPDYRLAWAEDARHACLDNLGPLSDVARALAARSGTTQPADVPQRAEAMIGARLYCPDGGKYEVSPDGRHVTCSVHGSAVNPRQPSAPAASQPSNLYGTSGVTAALTFLEDGLHVVVNIQR